jgi:dihydroneopterin aldolase
MKIHLKDVKMFAYHGLDIGEDILGGEYEINLTVSYIPAIIPLVELNETVDYTKLHLLLLERMKKPAKLLEAVATELASEIIAKFPIVNEVEISITKLHPPIVSFQGSVGVTFKINRIEMKKIFIALLIGIPASVFSQDVNVMMKQASNYERSLKEDSALMRYKEVLSADETMLLPL